MNFYFEQIWIRPVPRRSDTSDDNDGWCDFAAGNCSAVFLSDVDAGDTDDGDDEGGGADDDGDDDNHGAGKL